MPYLPVGVVGVAGAESLDDVAVVLRALVDVADQQRDRRARGAAFVHAGEDFDVVGFVPLRGVAAAPVARRSRSARKSSAAIASPGGQPSTTQPIAGPWLSPKVVTVSSFPNELLDIDVLDQRLLARARHAADLRRMLDQFAPIEQEHAHLADVELDPVERHLRQQFDQRAFARRLRR
jgi:hypothetical protein